jgi:hypothetical protein
MIISLPSMIITVLVMWVGLAASGNSAGLPLPFGAPALPDLPAAAWLGVGLVALVVLVTATVLAVIFQAATSRATALAAAGQSFSLRQALSLTRPQLTRIVRLGLVFGAAVALLALLPGILPMLISPGPGRARVLSFMQTTFSPLSTILSLILLLLLISAALEDILPYPSRPPKEYLRTGWWAFLVVFGFVALSGVGAAVMVTLPLVPLIVLALLAGSSWFVLLPCFGLVGLFATGLILFAGVYSLVLYTLVYRLVARQTALGIPLTV